MKNTQPEVIINIPPAPVSIDWTYPETIYLRHLLKREIAEMTKPIEATYRRELEEMLAKVEAASHKF
jgi:hypothetical protein